MTSAELKKEIFNSRHESAAMSSSPTIMISIEGKRCFTLNSATSALKSAFAPISRIRCVHSIGLKVTHRFHIRVQIRRAIYTMHGLLFKLSDVSQTSKASCFTLSCMLNQDTQAFFFSPHDVSQRRRKVSQFSDRLQFSAFFIFYTFYLLSSACVRLSWRHVSSYLL